MTERLDLNIGISACMLNSVLADFFFFHFKLMFLNCIQNQAI